MSDEADFALGDIRKARCGAKGRRKKLRDDKGMEPAREPSYCACMPALAATSFQSVICSVTRRVISSGVLVLG